MISQHIDTQKKGTCIKLLVGQYLALFDQRKSSFRRLRGVLACCDEVVRWARAPLVHPTGGCVRVR